MLGCDTSHRHAPGIARRRLGMAMALLVGGLGLGCTSSPSGQVDPTKDAGTVDAGPVEPDGGTPDAGQDGGLDAGGADAGEDGGTGETDAGPVTCASPWQGDRQEGTAAADETLSVWVGE